MQTNIRTKIHPKGDWDESVILIINSCTSYPIELASKYAKYAENSLIVSYSPITTWCGELSRPHPHPNEDVINEIQSLGSQFSQIVDQTRKKYSNKIILVGESIGGCIALQTAMQTKVPFTITHNGCLFSRHQARNKTAHPIQMFCYKNDKCFSYEHRYEPTLKWLQEKGNNVSLKTYSVGVHEAREMDIQLGVESAFEYFSNLDGLSN